MIYHNIWINYILYSCSLQRDSETREELDRIEFFKRTRYNEKKGWISDEAKSRYVRKILTKFV